MSTLPTATLIQSIADLLTEAYAGPPNPSSTWFIDNEPDSGILGILAGVSAAEAPTFPLTAAVGPERPSQPMPNTFAGAWRTPMLPCGVRPTTAIGAKAGTRSMRTLPPGKPAPRAANGVKSLRGAIQKQDELSGDYSTGVLALLLMPRTTWEPPPDGRTGESFITVGS